MERLSKAFDDLISELGIEKAVTVEILRDRWNTIIGGEIASHTSPDFFKNGQLVIAVDSPEWLHELRYHQSSILSKLEPFDINSVRFKLGSIKRRVHSKPRSNERSSPTKEDMDFAEDTSASITDESLKNAIRKAIERSLGSL